MTSPQTRWSLVLIGFLLGLIVSHAGLQFIEEAVPIAAHWVVRSVGYSLGAIVPVRFLAPTRKRLAAMALVIVLSVAYLFEPAAFGGTNTVVAIVSAVIVAGIPFGSSSNDYPYD